AFRHPIISGCGELHALRQFHRCDLAPAMPGLCLLRKAELLQMPWCKQDAHPGADLEMAPVHLQIHATTLQDHQLAVRLPAGAAASSFVVGGDSEPGIPKKLQRMPTNTRYFL